MSIKDEQIRRAIGERAAEWFCRLRAGDLTANEKREFWEWIRTSPQHIDEYLRVAKLMGKLRVAADGVNFQLDMLVEAARRTIGKNVVAMSPVRSPDPLTGPKRHFGRGKIIGLVAAILTTFITLHWAGLFSSALPPVSELIGWPETFEVAHGEQRTVKLRDGSTAHLNSSTRMTVRYSKSRRLIQIDRGQAFFDVAKDPTRPFVVRAGDTEVVAVGTQFDVYRKTDSTTTVTVVEGKVRVVDRKNAISQASSTNASDKSGTNKVPAVAPIALEAGEQLKIAPEIVALTPVAVDTRLATAWVRHEVAFSETPLAEVAAEFNRYLDTPIFIEDDELRAYRVSGVFQSHDADSFVAYLRQFRDISVEQSAGEIRVRRRLRPAASGLTVADQKHAVVAQ